MKKDAKEINLKKLKQKQIKLQNDVIYDDSKLCKTNYLPRLLDDKGFLNMYFTLNTENLEEKTGIDMKKVILSNGSNNGAFCSKC